MIDETLDLLIEIVRDEAAGLPSDDLVHDNLRYLLELKALQEAAGKVVDELGKHPVGTPISSTDLHWYGAALRALLSPLERQP